MNPLQLKHWHPFTGVLHFCIALMCLTGPFLFGDYLTHTDHLSHSLNWLLDVHGFFANFVWIYWCGHVGMALLTFYIERKKTK